jgi:phosphatidylserine synthase 2
MQQSSEHPTFKGCPTWVQLLTIAAMVPALLINTYWLFVSTDEARSSLLRILPGYNGTKLADKDYEIGGCGWDSVVDKILDPFVLSHFGGWFCIGLVGRNWIAVTIFSGIDELCELWWRDAHGNFRECWWDHIILDMLLCNMGGAWCADRLLRYLKVEMYSWGTVATRDWLSVRVFFNFVLIKVFTMFNLFGFKSVFYVPDHHWINPLRIIFLSTASAFCVFEWYHVLKSRSYERIAIARLWTIFLWVFIFAEFAVHNKMGYGDPIWNLMYPNTRILMTVGSLLLPIDQLWHLLLDTKL